MRQPKSTASIDNMQQTTSYSLTHIQLQHPNRYDHQGRRYTDFYCSFSAIIRINRAPLVFYVYNRKYVVFTSSVCRVFSIKIVDSTLFALHAASIFDILHNQCPVCIMFRSCNRDTVDKLRIRSYYMCLPLSSCYLHVDLMSTPRSPCGLFILPLQLGLKRQFHVEAQRLNMQACSI